MGCGMLSSEQNNLIDKQINQELKSQKRRDSNYRKIMVVGCNKCGISTIFKQLTQVYGKEFDQTDRMTFIPLIHKQCINQMKLIIKLLNEINKQNQLYPISTDALNAIKIINNMKQETELIFNDLIVSSIKCLWNEPSVKRVYERRNRLNINLNDSISYFWDEMDRINAFNYCPTSKDIILSNNKIGNSIQELCINIKQCPFLFVDINKCNYNSINKWINQFEHFWGNMFVASLSCYDSMQHIHRLELLIVGYIYNIIESIIIPNDLIKLIMTFYPNMENKMDKQMLLFENYVNQYYFKFSSHILILNKKDLFAHKIEITPITVCQTFNDFDGDPHSYNQCIDYICKTFAGLNHNKEQKIYTHVINALDKNEICDAFNGIYHLFVHSPLYSYQYPGQFM